MTSNRPDNFRNLILTMSDARDLVAVSGPDPDVKARLLLVMGELGRQPPGAFDDICHLLDVRAVAGSSNGHVSDVIRAMRDFWLDRVNRQLQRLYRGFFEAHPEAFALSHAGRIAKLDAVRDEACRLLRAHEWPWIAQWLRLDLIGESAATCLETLSNFAFPRKRISFRFSYHCNISCRHCYNESGPQEKAQRITLTAMLDVIDQMPGAGVHALNLEGGEPFMYPDDVMALVAAGRAAGLASISVYTNAFWATSGQAACHMLERLKRAGLMSEPGDYVKVSGGIYHQEFIGFDRILTAARCYHEMFGRPIVLDYELPPDAPGAARDLQARLNAARVDVELRFRRVTALGRATGLQGRELDPIDRPCRIIDQIVFDPDGIARPCCGFNNENYGVSIGRLGHDSLRQLIKRMQNDPLLQFLATRSMSDIFAHVSVPKSDAGYRGQCSLCQHAIGDLRDKEALQARLFDRQAFYPFWFSLDDLTADRSAD